MSRSAPAFPVDYSTENATLFVIGSAPCLMADLNIAKGLRPSHRIMAINDAAGWLPADFIYSGHPEKIAEFRAKQLQHGTNFTTHTRRRGREHYGPEIDFVWSEVFAGATSGIGGAHVGMLMRFPEIILCGCPMYGGDGYFGKTHPGTASDPRFGFGAPTGQLVSNYRSRLRDFATIANGVVFSMSGITRQVLGAPPEVPVYGH